MTAEQLEQLRISILVILAKNPLRFGYSTGHIRTFAALEGRPQLTVDEVHAELLYLEDKGLAVATVKTVSPELRAWRITAAGRDFLAERGIS